MENEKRKKRNLEIERVKRQRTNAAKIIAVAVAAVLVAAACFGIWSRLDGRTIMHVNGERVAESDFHFVTLLRELDGTPPTEESHAAEMDMLVRSILVLQRAAEEGLAVSDEDMESLEEEAAGLREMLQWHPATNLNFITDRRIAEIWSSELVFNMLMDELMTDFEMSEEDEAELEEFVAEGLEGVRDRLATREIKYVATLDESALTAAVAAGTDFDTIIREYCIFYNEEGIVPIEFWSFVQQFDVSWEEWMEMMPLDAGEISHVFESGGLYFAVYVESRFVDEELVAEEEVFFRENFERARRTEVFIETVNEWVEAADVQINERTARRTFRRAERRPPIMFG